MSAENLGVPGGHNLSSPHVEIGLTDLPKSGGGPHGRDPCTLVSIENIVGIGSILAGSKLCNKNVSLNARKLH